MIFTHQRSPEDNKYHSGENNLQFFTGLNASRFVQEYRSLVLPGITDCVSMCRFFVSHYNDILFEKMGISFPPLLNNALTLRRAEYLAGRILAKINLIPLNLAEHTLLPDRNGIPQWPTGISGSLSHNRQIAVCAILQPEQASLVGIDIETLLSPKDAQQLWQYIITPQEYTFLMTQPLAFHQLLTLVFSAKESFYKLVFPKVQIPMNFHSIQFIDFNLQDGQFSLTIPEALTAFFYHQRYITGRFLLMDDNIITFICI